ncbi:uroporphyrinogen-III synthase-like isoform X2 [Diaphorina citri]|uniref:Uroporphyrinogen-III synthase n=1 Tax=Diaphorina citri TaxID=121845 RepID=A0A1S3D7H0_DIACI|nr:uroporphyrinogen-III synthase-like isoform X2 [Diaphorina citri]
MRNDRSQCVNMKHLVTLFKAAAEDKDLYHDTIQSANISCQIIPVIDFRCCNLDGLKEKLRTPEKYSGLILSSPRCVTSLKQSLASEELDPAWKNKHCFAVGPATEKLARKLFDLNPVGSEAGKAANLAPIIVKSLGTQKDLPLLMPASNLAPDNISSALSKENITVYSPTVYETIPSPHLEENIVKSINASHENILVFFSPSGANSALPFLEQNILKTSKIISIGTTTADALTKSGVVLSGVCQQPTAESLLELIKPLTHDAK